MAATRLHLTTREHSKFGAASACRECADRIALAGTDAPANTNALAGRRLR
jgi:hypothetical protein